MEILEKVAYMKGLAEGLSLDTKTKEGNDHLLLHDAYTVGVHLKGKQRGR